MFDGLDPSVQPFFINGDQVPVWATRVRPHLEKMAEGSGGRYLWCDLLAAIAAGRMQLWVAIKGGDLLCVMLTEIMQYPRVRAMRLIGLVGSRPRVWAHLLDAIEASARENFGCQKMEALHLPRFRTILPGYETTHWMGEKYL